MIRIFFSVWFLLWLTSCASVDQQMSEAEGEGFSAKEEQAFLEEEDSDEELEAELDAETSEVAESPTEEEQAEDELAEIEDEFAEFVDEEEEELDAEAESSLAEGEASPSETPIDEEPQDAAAAEDEEIASDEQIEDESDIIASEDESLEETEGERENEAPSALSQITNIRYSDGHIYIDGQGDLSYRSRFNEASRQFVIEIPSARIMDQLKWPYIMKEFASHFAMLEADQKTKDTVRVVIQMRPDAKAPSVMEQEGGLMIAAEVADFTESDVAEEDSDFEEGPDRFDEGMAEGGGFTDEASGPILGAKTIQEFLSMKDQKFYGNPVTLDIREANLKDVLYFLVEESGINMIISDKIPAAEKVNFNLREIPWDQALVLIMKQKNLGYIREGNIVTISTIDEILQKQNTQDALLRGGERPTDHYGELHLEVIPINYAKASALVSKINFLSSKTLRKETFIKADPESNYLMVRDTMAVINKMKDLIRVFDRAPKQIMISAKFVEASEFFTSRFGVSWGLSGAPISLNAIGGGQVNISTSPFLQAFPGFGDLGTLGSRLRVGTFKYVGDLDAIIGLSETGPYDVKVISSPRVITLNGESAEISQKSQTVGYSTSVNREGGGGVSTTEAKVEDTGELSLSVTPDVTNANSVYMKVNMKRSFPGTPSGGGEAQATPKFERSASANILVKDGHTAVIGGIYEKSDQESTVGLPILKHIPFINWLFSQKNTNKTKIELLLFLTPRILPWDENQNQSAEKDNGSVSSKSS